MTNLQKLAIAEAIFFFDPYGSPEIIDEHHDLFDDPEAIIADLIEWYIGGELIEEDDEQFLDLIRKIRLTATLEF